MQSNFLYTIFFLTTNVKFGGIELKMCNLLVIARYKLMGREIRTMFVYSLDQFKLFNYNTNLQCVLWLQGNVILYCDARQRCINVVITMNNAFRFLLFTSTALNSTLLGSCTSLKKRSSSFVNCYFQNKMHFCYIRSCQSSECQSMHATRKLQIY